MPKVFLTADSLKEWFEYKEGNLFWKQKPCRWIKIGDKVGSLRKDGYVEVGFKNKQYLLHRLIFLYHYNYLPDLIDHIDQNPSNNKIENLREASKKQNSYNSKLFKHNKSGHRGISWSKRDGKWVVRYKTEEKYIYGGSFINMYEAILCRQKLEKKGGV